MEQKGGFTIRIKEKKILMQNDLFESLKRMGDYMEARLMSMFRNRSSLWVGKTKTELVEECEGKTRRKLPSRKVMLRRAWRKNAERQ